MTIADLALVLELEWGTRPRLSLALNGGSDMHWQVFHPDDCYKPEPMPRYTLLPDGTLEKHPG